LKYFEKELNAEKNQKPIFNEGLVLCGSLYDNIDPKSGVSIKEEQKHKKNKVTLSQIKGKWVRQEFLEKFSG